MVVIASVTLKGVLSGVVLPPPCSIVIVVPLILVFVPEIVPVAVNNPGVSSFTPLLSISIIPPSI